MHGKKADSENNGGYLRILLSQPGAEVYRQISAGPLISVSMTNGCVSWAFLWKLFQYWMGRVLCPFSLCWILCIRKIKLQSFVERPSCRAGQSPVSEIPSIYVRTTWGILCTGFPKILWKFLIFSYRDKWGRRINGNLAVISTKYKEIQQTEIYAHIADNVKYV